MLAKRLFDLALTLPGLLLLSPVLLLISLWIKLDGRGSVLFRQQRVGMHEKLFDVLKFRTMVIDAEKQGLKITVGRDPRITRSGHILRKFKLDELPQLINVLKGDMSLVGPRPEVPEYVAYYSDQMKRKIFSVPPGITDLASIEFKDENALLAGAENPKQVYIETILPQKLALSEKYIEQRGVLMDMRLIFRTLLAIIR